MCSEAGCRHSYCIDTPASIRPLDAQIALKEEEEVSSAARLIRLFFSSLMKSSPPLVFLLLQTFSVSLSSQNHTSYGSFGYENYPSGSDCEGSISYVYGFALGECSSTGASSSLRYMWCGRDSSGDVLFNLVRYNTIDCGGAPSWNHTYTVSRECDTAAHRRPICLDEVEGWKSYNLRQHSTVFFNDSCTGPFNYWQAENSDCTDDSYCTDANHGMVSKGYCDRSSALQYDDDVCFHVASSINYQGKTYSFEQLNAGDEPECTIPHAPRSLGVRVVTTCNKTARVTDTHLMATSKGYRMAYSLKPGDILFGSFGDEDRCEVLRVEKEGSEQQYFGLNCVHSEVLVSGLRASTFGDFHTLPSWYMSYVGRYFGPQVSSKLGTYISELFHSMS